MNQNLTILRPELENPVYWLLIVGILSYLLVSKISLLGFKFQNFKWSENKFRYTFIMIAAILGLIVGYFRYTLDYAFVYSSFTGLAIPGKLSTFERYVIYHDCF